MTVEIVYWRLGRRPSRGNMWPGGPLAEIRLSTLKHDHGTRTQEPNLPWWLPVSRSNIRYPSY